MVLDGDLGRAAAHVAQDLRREGLCLRMHRGEPHDTGGAFRLFFLRGACTLHLLCTALPDLIF